MAERKTLPSNLTAQKYLDWFISKQYADSNAPLQAFKEQINEFPWVVIQWFIHPKTCNIRDKILATGEMEKLMQLIQKSFPDQLNQFYVDEITMAKNLEDRVINTGDHPDRIKLQLSQIRPVFYTEEESHMSELLKDKDERFKNWLKFI